MSNISNLRDTIVPKSDQLNADDLIAANKIITITGVRRGGHDDPIIINYEGDDGRPYKPCKSMRRVLIFAYGDDGNNWIGKSMELYCDPKVKFAGKEVGGIRIKALSGIPKPITMKLTATRGSRADFRVNVLQEQEKPPYPDAKFNEAFPVMKQWIEEGKMTTEQVIAKCESTGKLNDEQRQRIRECDISNTEEDATDTEFFNEEQ
jgi:hypothetical protein